MKLIDCCLELWIFLYIISEYLFSVCLSCYREVSCLCIPVSLRFSRYKELNKFPCCSFLDIIIVIQCPKGSATDGNTAFTAINYCREISSANFKFTVYILKNLLQGSC